MIVHDVLVTTIPERVASAASVCEQLRMASWNPGSDHDLRITVVVDGDWRDSSDSLRAADRVIVHRYPQGIACTCAEWVALVRANADYYGDGTTKRTNPRMSAISVYATMVQDDVKVDVDLFSFFTAHRAEIFSRADWFSGYDPTEHRLTDGLVIGGRRVNHREMGCAVHLTAPVCHWTRVMPIPKEFCRARLSPGGDDYAPEVERGHPSAKPRLGSRLEHWLQGDAPYFQGIKIRGCITAPGMVEHIGESTWNA